MIDNDEDSEKEKDSTKRRAALNYLLSQLFANNDYNEFEQQLIQMVQNKKESDPFVVKEDVLEVPKQMNYPGFTGKRFTALQSKIDKHEAAKNEEIDGDTGA